MSSLIQRVIKRSVEEVPFTIPTEPTPKEKKPKDLPEWEEIKKILKEMTPGAQKMLDEVAVLYAKRHELADKAEKMEAEASMIRGEAEKLGDEQKKIAKDFSTAMGYLAGDFKNKELVATKYKDFVVMLYEKVSEKKIKPTAVEKLEHVFRILKKRHENIFEEMTKDLEEWEKKAVETKEIREDIMTFVTPPKGTAMAVKLLNQDRVASMFKTIWQRIRNFGGWIKTLFQGTKKLRQEVEQFGHIVQSI